jgi:hypothetical protein
MGHQRTDADQRRHDETQDSSVKENAHAADSFTESRGKSMTTTEQQICHRWCDDNHHQEPRIAAPLDGVRK